MDIDATFARNSTKKAVKRINEKMNEQLRLAQKLAAQYEASKPDRVKRVMESVLGEIVKAASLGLDSYTFTIGNDYNDELVEEFTIRGFVTRIFYSTYIDPYEDTEHRQKKLEVTW